MNGILNVPDQEISFILDNLSIDQFTPVNEVNNLGSMFATFEAGGPPITLITNNMPVGLKDELITIIKKYCNH